MADTLTAKVQNRWLVAVTLVVGFVINLMYHKPASAARKQG